jgi:glycosyltransferase involved in cell wall biosynthesis
MRIAYVTPYDPHDRSQWSGSGFGIFDALQRQGLEVIPVGPLKPHFTWLGRQKRRFYHRLFGQSYEVDREAFVGWDYAWQIQRRLAKEPCDVVLSPGATPISRLKCRQPIVCWADATFASLISHYPSYKNLCRETIRSGHRTERLALRRCALALFTSEWAAQSAIADYQLDPAKVQVEPFGANLRSPPAAEEALAAAARRPTNVCSLISIGVEWQRKGMPRAVQLASMLNARRIPTTLTIVGCQPPAGETLPDFVKLAGFINKSTPTGEQTLGQLYSQSHFHVLFSEAECYGVVFAEANAYAVPNIASDVGGIRSAVVDGRGGRCFRLDAPLEEAADYIAAHFQNPPQYQALARAARREYDERLNWQTIGASARRHLERVVQNHEARS